MLRGIVSVRCGYAGGSEADAKYELVCAGKTGHVEVVEIVYDDTVLSVVDLLECLFYLHDPTTANRAGADIGPQYHSTLFYTTPEEKAALLAKIAAMQSEEFKGRPIVTSILPLIRFFAAEDYHQDYLDKHPEATYCKKVTAPKVKKFKEKFASLLKSQEQPHVAPF
jgi:peptide-methionine (S)-S-oxide reductase